LCGTLPSRTTSSGSANRYRDRCGRDREHGHHAHVFSSPSTPASEGRGDGTRTTTTTADRSNPNGRNARGDGERSRRRELLPLEKAARAASAGDRYIDLAAAGIRCRNTRPREVKDRGRIKHQYVFVFDPQPGRCTASSRRKLIIRGHAIRLPRIPDW
jgi:hypothetical protein